MNTNARMRSWAHLVLRGGISLVVIWFGYSQLVAPERWTAMVPAYATAIIPLSAATLVWCNAVFELLFGIALLLGLYTRFVAGILTLHLFHIMTIVGYDAIGVRDFGLAIAMFSTFLHGPDTWSLDRWAKQKQPPQPSQPLQPFYRVQ